MPEYLTPGVYFEFRDASPPVIRRIRTDITGFVGLAERGPLHQPVQIESWRQFQAQFGSFVPYSFLAYSVKGFFENGGRTCFIVRIAGHTAAKAARTLKNKRNRDVLRISAANEGIWGNKIAVILTQVFPDKCEFSLLITRNRLEQESFPNLSLRAENKRYFARIINEGDDRTARSQWVQVEDLIHWTGPCAADDLPNAAQSGFVNHVGFLESGRDGVASVTIDDFLGVSDPFIRERKGLSAFDHVDAIGIICVPDIHIQPALFATAPPATTPQDPCLPCSLPTPTAVPSDLNGFELPPQFSEAEIITVQRAMIEHCERQKDRVAILEAPLRRNSSESLTLAEVLDWRSQFESERGFGAFYYPWIKMIDPLRLNGNPVRTVPPCGHVAGLYARSDFTIGVHKAPANAELFWAEDITVEINDERQAILNPEGINCLRAFPGRGIRVYGGRTVSSNPDWRYVNVRRLMLMIEEAVDEATQWSVFEPHDFNLRQTLVLSVSSFLESLWRQGALVGATAQEAFFVKCDETNNPPEVVDQGRLVADIGVAPTKPAEFVVFRVGRTLEELEIVER